MALILILDKANTGRWNRPRVRAVICDGFVLFSEKQLDKDHRGMFLHAGEDAVDPIMLAQGLARVGVGDVVRDEIIAELKRIAAEKKHEEIKAKWEEARKENDRPGNDSRPAGGDAGESGNGE